MGQITIEVPQKLNKTYRIVSEGSADEVLKKLDLLVREANHTGNDEVLGMWSDREESVDEIAEKLRQGWNRNVGDD